MLVTTVEVSSQHIEFVFCPDSTRGSLEDFGGAATEWGSVKTRAVESPTGTRHDLGSVRTVWRTPFSCRGFLARGPS